MRLPAGLSIDDGADRLREAFPGILIADNSIYAPSGQISLPTQDYARNMVGWTPGVLDCAAGMRIGLIDTRVDPAAPGLASLRIVARSMLPEGVPDAPALHGTAIAEIIAGDGGGMPPLVPTPALYNAAIFERLADGSAGASAVAFAEALDWLVGEAVPLANISLAGARNPLIEIAIDRASARGLLMVAAVGNDGPDGATAWPAAHPRHRGDRGRARCRHLSGRDARARRRFRGAGRERLVGRHRRRGPLRQRNVLCGPVRDRGRRGVARNAAVRRRSTRFAQPLRERQTIWARRAAIPNSARG